MALARIINPFNIRLCLERRGHPVTRFTLQPVWPSPQSQSFSRSYGSNLPTSLTYIVLSTRGCAPWRPAADMGTAWHENHTVSVGFSRADPDAPDTARAAVLYGQVSIPCPYLRASRFQGVGPLQRKENSSRGPSRRLPLRLRCRTWPLCRDLSPCPGSGILTRFPFDGMGAQVSE